MTKDDKTSIKDGLSKLLELFKDVDKDSLALENQPNAEEVDLRSSMDAGRSLKEKSESREGTGNHSEQIKSPRYYIDL